MFFIHPHRLCRTLFISACLILAFICFAVPFTTHAQDLDDAAFQGRVTDPNGAPVPGATVTATLTTGGVERTATTGDDGRYRLVELQPGTYQVRVAATGFADTVQTFENLISGQTVRNDVELTIGIADNVEVTTDAPTIDTTRTVVGGTITTEEIESLPNISRQALDFVFTLPGVSEEPLSTRDTAEDRIVTGSNNNSPNSRTPEEAGNFALSGGPASSNNITIDGLDNNDDRAATERFQPSIETIEEVQVITNQFAAEYGRASGGRINIRTRAGTNRFRGRGFYFFRDEALNANTFNNNARGVSRLPLQQHTPGFTFSGPVFLPRFGEGGDALYNGRSRTFFFVGYERDNVLETALIDTLVPVVPNAFFALPAPTTLTGRRLEQDRSVEGVFDPVELAPFLDSVSTPLTNNIFSARVDHRFTQAHNGTASFQFGRLRNLRQFGGGGRLAEGLLARERNTEALSYTDNYVFSPTVVNQLRTQVSRLEPGVRPTGDRPVVIISIFDTLPTGDPLRRAGSLTAGASTLGATDRRENRFQIQDTLSVVAGSHSLKFGADFQQVRSTFLNAQDTTGTFNFSGFADFFAGRPNRFRQIFGTQSTQRNNYFGVFVQDEWQARRNLSLSYGLRYERESILKDNNNFGPRAALAYDPFGSGKTVIRAGGGIFYNRVLLRTIDDFTTGSTEVRFDTNFLPVNERQPFIDANIRFAQPLAANSPLLQNTRVTLRNTGTGTGSFGQLRFLDPDLRIPESYQANVGFERDIGGRFVVEANYTYNRGLHLFREFNPNAPVLPSGFRDFSEYLQSREFDNRVVNGVRPVLNVVADRVRFAVAPAGTDVNSIPIASGVATVFLNSTASTNSARQLTAAISALRNLRPNPNLVQVEQLISVGDSYYHGLTAELRRRFSRIGKSGFGLSTRVAYTLARLEDDGIVNTSEALVPGDFNRERARSILDRRHRFAFSGAFDTPRFLGGIRFSPILRISSGAPFQLGLGGVDRNLDDLSNDRPNFTGDPAAIRTRESGEPIPAGLIESFSQPLIGQTGNQPRTIGQGPGQFIFDISATRDFRIGERVRLRPVIEAGNVLNTTVFTFGSEFIDFGVTQFARDNFLVPRRTLRARQLRVGLRFDF